MTERTQLDSSQLPSPAKVQAGISPGEQNRALLKSVEELEEQKRMMARRTFPAVPENEPDAAPGSNRKSGATVTVPRPLRLCPSAPPSAGGVRD